MTNIENITNEIMGLFEKYGHHDCDGQPVCQASHMIQCAMLAMEEVDADLTIGALLHDIGCLLEREQNTQQRVIFGVATHEEVGASFLKSMGFSERVCSIVAIHRAAKRYLVTINKAYALKLSQESLEALKWQGGPMTYDEIEEFASHPYFDDIIKVRLWDERAREADTPTLPLSFFRKLIFNHLSDITQNEGSHRSCEVGLAVSSARSNG